MPKAFLTGNTALSRRWFMCPADGCVERVSRARAPEMFCGTHWNLVPSDLRALIEKKYRPKRVEDDKWSKPFVAFMCEAVRELKHIAMVGHRIPQPADFMFDDPPAPSEQVERAFDRVPAVHRGPCIEALADEVDTDDPAKVTCSYCLERSAQVKPMTYAQQRRAGQIDAEKES